MPKTFLTAYCCFFLLSLSAQTWFQTGQDADLMVSGVDFNRCGGYFNHPNGLASDGLHFLVCDRFNNRILVWNTLPDSWDDAPDLVLGQPDFEANNPGTGKNNLNWVGNASLGANGKLAVADTENDRILLWNSFPTQNGQAADVSIDFQAYGNPNSGQFYGWPWGVWTDGQKLAAVATAGGAILFWNTFPDTDNTPPDYIVKLPEFGTPRNISTDGSSYFFVGDHNAKVNDKPGTFFWNSYPNTANQPYDFYRDEWIKGEKLPDGKLIAGGLQSIYLWNTMPVDGSHSPDLSLKPSMYKNGDGVDLLYAGGRLYVNNYNGNDVLVFNQIPSSAGQLPDFALGSPGIQAQTLDSIHYVQNPVLSSDGQRLIATSDFDRAIYIWNSLPDHSGQPYDQKIALTGNVQVWASTLFQNTFVVGGRNSLSVWKDAGALQNAPDYTLVNQIGAAMLDDIRGVALDDHFFYLATQSGKLYIWNGLPDTSNPDPLFTLSSNNGPYAYLYSDGEYCCASRPEPPSGVDIYRISDLLAGNTTPFKVISSGSVRINQATQGVTFGGALAITSRGDHRVLLWKDIADAGILQKAVVLGQPDQQSDYAAIGKSHLFMPNSLLPLGNALWVGEFKFSSRILKFSQGTSAVNMPDTSALEASFYPNPANTSAVLAFTPKSDGACRVELLDAAGAMRVALFTGELNAGQRFELPMDTGHWAPGMYIIRIETEAERAVLKVLKF